MPQARAHQRAEHAHAPQRDLLPFVGGHHLDLPHAENHFGWDHRGVRTGVGMCRDSHDTHRAGEAVDELRRFSKAGGSAERVDDLAA